MLTTFRDSEISLNPIRDAGIAVVGFGRQGKAHALNLRDSGLDVTVALREGSPRRREAEDEGLTVVSLPQAADCAHLLSIMLPDRVQAEVFEQDLSPHLGRVHTILFAGGYSVHFGGLEPPDGLDVVLVAPMGAGYQVREFYLAGGGVPAKVAVHQDVSGEALPRALAYAKAVGCSRAGCLLTTFAQEVELDLFSEQVVLCGGIPQLIILAYRTLVEAGYPAELAYIETVREVKLITDLIYECGIAGMRERISDTALVGGAAAGPRLIDEGVRERMGEILDEIREGSSVEEFGEEFDFKRADLEGDIPQGMEEARRVVEGLYWKDM